MSHFSCRSVTRNYDNKPVVRDISLSLEKGELCCLLGPSGVGKTTLMGVLSGLDRPDEGGVFLEGGEITGRPGRVGYMLQKDLLLHYKTLLDNVSLPLLIGGMGKKAARKEASRHLEAFGLFGCEKLYPHQLSGGMRQRAALLRSWLAGNSVMLLDEPFSALDAITKRQIHAWYLDIVKKIGTTTLFITHDIDEALVLSDRIYIMGGVPGRITMELPVHPGRPRGADFATSEAFLRQKRRILAAIDS